MFKILSQVTKDILTEKDGESYDVTKVQWFVGTVVFFVCTLFGLWKHPELGFDYVKFGMGFSAIMAAGSFGVKIKETTEQTVEKSS